ncbi:MAG: 2-C-methyl-D-erythritol 4-phosphate cytidylyltransferase [Candidatus Eremiobacteraeota bacterium]|nr:2-C-methyl-D-erythritol 4-phosphate cytidylyltransferase [Candidatus Eremiobacteraeota bacterium]
MKWAAVIVAAGRGLRFGRPKQFLDLAGTPMVGWSIRTFAAMPEIAELIVATEAEAIRPMRVLLKKLAPSLGHRVVQGGEQRQDSVRNALSALSPETSAVLVHDGARPLVTVQGVRSGMRDVRAGRAALLATPVVDTIKLVDLESRRVSETLDRRFLWAAQTPQFATVQDLRNAHATALRDNFRATDDATLLERVHVEVLVVPSAEENFKVTLPEDAARAEAILQARIVAVNAG